MTYPKEAWCGRRPRPYVPALSDIELNWLIGRVTDRERQALRVIVDRADLLEVDGNAYLLVAAPGWLLHVLAAFEADAEDREPDLCDEPQADDEPSLGWCNPDPDVPQTMAVHCAGGMFDHEDEHDGRERACIDEFMPGDCLPIAREGLQ